MYLGLSGTKNLTVLIVVSFQRNVVQGDFGTTKHCITSDQIDKTECHGAAFSLERCVLSIDPNDPDNPDKWKFVDSPLHAELNPNLAPNNAFKNDPGWIPYLKDTWQVIYGAYKMA